MKTKRAHFTKEEHLLAMGARLRDLHFRIWDLLALLQDAYPKSSKIMRAMLKLNGGAYGPFAELKSHLDSEFFRVCPGAETNESPYYGWRRETDDPCPNLAPLFLPQRRKPGSLSLDGHRDVSGRLHHIELELLATGEAICRAYGGSPPAGWVADQITKKGHVLALKRVMEDAACLEHGRAADGIYPSRSEARTA